MKRALFAIGTVVVGVVVVMLVGVGFRAQKYEPPNGTLVAKSLGTAVVNGKIVPHVQIHLATWPDASGTYQTAAFSPSGAEQTVPIHPSGNPSWPAYAPSNQFQVPAGALVDVVWDQYDSGGNLNNNYFATPQGVYSPDGKGGYSNQGQLGHQITVNGKAVSSIQEGNAAHTFTMRAEPGVDSGFFLSVASPVANPTNANIGNTDDPKETPPQVVKFSFVAGAKGLYAWNCEFPCGLGVGGFGAVMSTYGYMSGYLHVV
jgi:hypothetical protein